jgi:PIN domain nuclease of toxin-antitoxin system
MLTAVSDTHTVIWYLANDTRLSATARGIFENAAQQGHQIALSSITLVEMVYLVEKGRISAEHFTRLAVELGGSGSLLVEIPVSLAIARALSRVDVAQIADMPDRIIAATALHLNVPVISRDAKIRTASLSTIW